MGARELSKRLILLADDSVRMHRAVAIGLKDQPYELLSCDNGADALRLAKEKKPSVVLADLDMPGLNGLELLHQVRQDPSLQRIKVVLLCNSLEPVDEEALRKANPDAKLWKPFEPAALVALLQTLLKSEIRESSEPTVAIPSRPKVPLPKKAEGLLKVSDAPTDPVLSPATSSAESPDEADIARDMTFETFRVAAQSQEPLEKPVQKPSQDEPEFQPQSAFLAPDDLEPAASFESPISSHQAAENLSSHENLWGFSNPQSLSPVANDDVDPNIDLPRFEESDDYQIVTNPEIFVDQEDSVPNPTESTWSHEAPESKPIPPDTESVYTHWAADFQSAPAASAEPTSSVADVSQIKELIRKEFDSQFRQELRSLLKEELQLVLKELGESV